MNPPYHYHCQVQHGIHLLLQVEWAQWTKARNLCQEAFCAGVRHQVDGKQD